MALDSAIANSSRAEFRRVFIDSIRAKPNKFHLEVLSYLLWELLNAVTPPEGAKLAAPENLTQIKALFTEMDTRDDLFLHVPNWKWESWAYKHGRLPIFQPQTSEDTSIMLSPRSTNWFAFLSKGRQRVAYDLETRQIQAQTYESVGGGLIGKFKRENTVATVRVYHDERAIAEWRAEASDDEFPARMARTPETIFIDRSAKLFFNDSRRKALEHAAAEAPDVGELRTIWAPLSGHQLLSESPTAQSVFLNACALLLLRDKSPASKSLDQVISSYPGTQFAVNAKLIKEARMESVFQWASEWK